METLKIGISKQDYYNLNKRVRFIEFELIRICRTKNNELIKQAYKQYRKESNQSINLIRSYEKVNGKSIRIDYSSQLISLFVEIEACNIHFGPFNYN